MTLEVRRPDTISLEGLRKKLTPTGNELDVDVTVRELTDPRL